MKLIITMKSPDVLDDTLEAERDEIIGGLDSELDDDEKEMICEGRLDEAREAAKKWMRYGEYIDIEIDTKEGTAKVLEAK